MSAGEHWSWEECYFAVWGYDRLDRGDYDTKSEIFEEVSSLIGRTSASAQFKMQNVSSYDKRPRSDKPIGEKPNRQKLLGEVFHWFWGDKAHARDQEANVRAHLRSSGSAKTKKGAAMPRKKHLEVFVEEGAEGTTKIKTRKRSRKLVTEGRKFHADPDGMLSCKACGYKTPKSIKKETVQLHHTEPIHECDPKGKKIPLSVAVKSLLPLCPNCHVLAHSSHPRSPLELKEIRAVLGHDP
jgi:predicted HNH restriction endonuclease